MNTSAAIQTASIGIAASYDLHGRQIELLSFRLVRIRTQTQLSIAIITPTISIPVHQNGTSKTLCCRNLRNLTHRGHDLGTAGCIRCAFAKLTVAIAAPAARNALLIQRTEVTITGTHLDYVLKALNQTRSTNREGGRQTGA